MKGQFFETSISEFLPSQYKEASEGWLIKASEAPDN